MISLSSVEKLVWFGEDAGSGPSSDRHVEIIHSGFAGYESPAIMGEAERYPTSPAVSVPNEGKPLIHLSRTVCWKQ